MVFEPQRRIDTLRAGKMDKFTCNLRKYEEQLGTNFYVIFRSERNDIF